MALDGGQWVLAEPALAEEKKVSQSIKRENDDMNGFRYRPPDPFEYGRVPLYDEITLVDLDGNEPVKVVAGGSPKVNYPLSPEKKNISIRENTYVKAETYFEELKTLKPGEIAVSDIIGVYTPSNYIGMYTPSALAGANKASDYKIEYAPGEQAYAGVENPNGRRFEGIVRRGAPR